MECQSRITMIRIRLKKWAWIIVVLGILLFGRLVLGFLRPVTVFAVDKRYVGHVSFVDCVVINHTPVRIGAYGHQVEKYVQGEWVILDLDKHHALAGAMPIFPFGHGRMYYRLDMDKRFAGVSAGHPFGFRILSYYVNVQEQQEGNASSLGEGLYRIKARYIVRGNFYETYAEFRVE